MLTGITLETVSTKIRDIKRQRLDVSFVGKHAEFGTPLQSRKVDEFELQLGINLPEDFKNFVVEIGNGGFGPGLGLIPLGTESVIDARIPASDNRLLNPRGSFIYVSDWNFPPLRHAMETSSSDEDDLMDYYFSVDRIDGAIRIADLGCGAIALLVVNGHESGKIWLDYRGTFGGIVPATRTATDTDHIEFLNWYDAWLTEIILRLPMGQRHIV